MKRTDENADFDYGKKQPKQKNVKITPHDFRSGPDTGVRYSGPYADNAMEDPSALNEDNSVLDKLQVMFAKAGISAEQIMGGVRLSERGVQRAAARLGIAASEVPTLIASLVTKLRKEQSRSEAALMTEYENTDPRFSYEADYLGNVTIRDAQAGKKVFLRGAEAARLLKAAKRQPNNQELLSRYAPMMEGIHDEDDEQEHWDAYEETGHFGRAGSGCIILARSTGRILIPHRSDNPPPYDVTEPGTWGTWGGALDSGLTPIENVLKEVQEEAKYKGQIEKTLPLLVFQNGSYKYYNFLLVVPDEFTPRLNWESQGFAWVEFGQWPQPLHFGLKALLKDGKSIDTITAEIAQSKSLHESAELEEDSYDSEINADSGMYNFEWVLGTQKGFGSARFKGHGRKMNITVVSVRDASGQEIKTTLSDEQLEHIRHQAIDYIAKA